MIRISYPSQLRPDWSAIPITMCVGGSTLVELSSSLGHPLQLMRVRRRVLYTIRLFKDASLPLMGLPLVGGGLLRPPPPACHPIILSYACGMPRVCLCKIGCL